MSAFELYRTDILNEVKNGAHPELIALRQAVKLEEGELKSESVGDGAKSEDPWIRTGKRSKRGNLMFHPKVRARILSMFENISDEEHRRYNENASVMRAEAHVDRVFQKEIEKQNARAERRNLQTLGLLPSTREARRTENGVPQTGDLGYHALWAEARRPKQ